MGRVNYPGQAKLQKMSLKQGAQHPGFETVKFGGSVPTKLPKSGVHEAHEAQLSGTGHNGNATKPRSEGHVSKERVGTLKGID